MHRCPMPAEIAPDLCTAELRRGRPVAEQKDRQIAALELDPARTQAALQRKAEPITIERDAAFELGDINIGVDLEHRARKPLFGVIRLGAVEEALQRREMVLTGGLAAIARRGRVLPQGARHDMRRDFLQGPAGPHRVKLHLAGALEIIEPVIRLGDAPAARKNPVIGHQQHTAVRSEHMRQPLAFGWVQRQTAVFVVIGNRVEKGDLGLAERGEARLSKAGERGGKRHMSVQDAGLLRVELVDRGVDAKGGAFDLAFATQDLAVIADLHQAARGHLRPMQPERDLVITVALARHGQRKMVEDAFAQAVRHGEAMRRREIDPRVPLRRIDFVARAARFHQSHPGPLLRNCRDIRPRVVARATGLIGQRGPPNNPQSPAASLAPGVADRRAGATGAPRRAWTSSRARPARRAYRARSARRSPPSGAACRARARRDRARRRSYAPMPASRYWSAAAPCRAGSGRYRAAAATI